MFKDGHTKKFWCLVLIIFWANSNLRSEANKPQLTLGDKINVFSDKAYRKNNGRYFEAVGNVVIISQTDTIYGELASLDQESMQVKVEGNVRVVTKDMTLYGSHIEYNIATGSAVIRNARILALDFNLVANELVRINEKEYVAREAEFTTCRDCAESWSVFGKEIRIRVGSYVTIKHGLAKIKGVDVLYIPYIVLPIQTKRKTGLLFPKISTRLVEGLAFEQPIFVAIDSSKDATLSPTFWSKRGYGGDVQYRQKFSDLSWFETNSRILNDSIYLPGKSSLDSSGKNFFRYFTELETHLQPSSNLNSHFRYTGSRDLDIVRDHPSFTETKINTSDMGLSGFVDWRQNYFSVGVNADYLRNQLSSEPTEFDRAYVQTLPRVSLSSVPYTLVQTETPLLRHLAVGFDSSVTRFHQVDQEEGERLRNANRFSVQPYLMWHLLSVGPLSLRTRYTYDQQAYRFEDKDQPNFGKNAGIVKTEMSFTMDKIFGLAFEEKIPIKYIPEKDLKALREKKEQGLSPIKSVEKTNRLIGDLDTFESELAQDNIVQVRNSYRHSQEFKAIHHYISSENEYGNERFRTQINSYEGWFDYEDSVRSKEFQFGANTTRTLVPPENTMEFQWNNTLIRKRPKIFNYLVDDKYLRDNFSYSRIGWFNLSQGYLLNQDDFEDHRQRLTRLMLDTGYSTDRWIISMQEFYFHFEQQNIFAINFNRRFEYLRLLGNYNYNSFGESNLNTLSAGGQIRPTDTLGFAIMKDLDLDANKNIRTTYALDIMPHNNCWILNLNYRESLVDSRYSFNILFNFGDDNFSQYRSNYFGIKRQ
jgi:LPS-assembly protein